MKGYRGKILNYLIHNKEGLTVLNAQHLFGTTELRKVVMDLKNKGYNICDVWEEGYNRYCEKTRFKRYFLITTDNSLE